MLSNINLSTDTVILATFAFVVIVGSALGRDRLRHFALTVYMGLALAYELGATLTSFINGHGQSFTPGTIKLSLFIAPVLLLAFGKHGKTKGGQSFILTLLTSAFLACLIITSALHLMDPKQTTGYLADSQIATQLFRLRLVWLAVVPVSILVSLVAKPKSPH